MIKFTKIDASAVKKGDIRSLWWYIIALLEALFITFPRQAFYKMNKCLPPVTALPENYFDPCVQMNASEAEAEAAKAAKAEAEAAKAEAEAVCTQCPSITKNKNCIWCRMACWNIDYEYHYGIIPLKSVYDFESADKNIRITHLWLMAANSIDRTSFTACEYDLDKTARLAALKLNNHANTMARMMRGHADRSAFAALIKAKHADKNAAKVIQYKVNDMAQKAKMSNNGDYSPNLMDIITNLRKLRKLLRANRRVAARAAEIAAECA